MMLFSPEHVFFNLFCLCNYIVVIVDAFVFRVVVVAVVVVVVGVVGVVGVVVVVVALLLLLSWWSAETEPSQVVVIELIPPVAAEFRLIFIKCCMASSKSTSCMAWSSQHKT